MKSKTLLFLTLTLALLGACKKESPKAASAKETAEAPAQNGAALDEDTMSQGSPEDVGDRIVIPKPMTVLEFASASQKKPKGFSLTCREGTKEFRKVDEKKKIDARFCSADGKVAVSPVLRVQAQQHTLQTMQYRGTYTLEGGALSWVHNDGLLVNYAPSTKEWKVRLADATVHTFQDQGPCPFGVEIEKKIESVYGAAVCSR